MIGRHLAQYEIVAPLGKGGMGEVYRAYDPRLDRTVAIKTLPTEVARDPSRRRLFEREARSLAALQHPNAVQIFDFGVDGETAFAVMELLEGHTLEEEMRSRRVDPARAVDIAGQIARGLAAAHEKGIVHRDLKPANVMLMSDGQVKILDFGLARRRREVTEDATVELTVAELAGTPAYMAPERIAERDADHRADLYALGLILYEMLAGRHPFRRSSTAETVSAILRDTAPPMSNVDGRLRRLVDELLEKDPQRRLDSAATVVERLLKTLEPSDGGVHSIAVLPLHNEAEDEDAEILIDGLTDSLIDTLSGLPDLKVLARSTVFSRRELHDRPEEVGRELGVSAVLTGRLQRRGDTLVLRVELVDSTDGTRLWGSRIRRAVGDLFEIEEEICREIADKLRLQLTPSDHQRMARRGTANPDARDAYMRGRYIWNRWKSAESMRRAIHFFERAVELDPLYARAYAGLADSYGMLGNVKALPPEEAYPKAKSAALQGLAIDDQLAELHTSLGFVQRFWDWDWNASRASLNRALDLNPGYSTAHRFLGHLLCGLGEHDLAIAHTRRALDLDPLSLILHTAVGDAYFYARRYEEAMTWYRKCLELDATFVPGHTDLARSLELSGRFEEALEEFERARQLTSAAPNDPSAGLACVYASMGRSEEALAMQSELLARSPEQYVSPYSIASIHACLGDVESALTWLEKAYEEHDQTLVWVKVHPRLDVLRAEPRFQQILQKMRL